MASTPQTSWPLSWISRWHHAFVFHRRTRVIGAYLWDPGTAQVKAFFAPATVLATAPFDD
jgi:hypothetical protein